MAPPRPIIIIGSKGSGKTTFINHFIRFNIDELKTTHLLLYLDLKKVFNASENFDIEKLSKTIIENIYESYADLNLHSTKVLKRIYFKQIKLNCESIWEPYFKQEDKKEYDIKLSTFFEDVTTKYSEHLKFLNTYLIRERRKRLIVIIDNADQYSKDIQEAVFSFAQSLSKNAFCGTIISLREGYYYKWKNSPPIDAFESNVFHISAPDYSEVLSKRIEYAIESIKSDYDKRILGTNDINTRYNIPIAKIIQFMEGVNDSVFSENNSELIDYLYKTTYPNIREGLRIFQSFLTSGHTKTDEYIMREFDKNYQNRVETQIIPIHEFFKSICLHHKLFYNSKVSSVFNVFIPPNKSTDQFIIIYFLLFLSNHIEKDNPKVDYVCISEIKNKFISYGYSEQIILQSISTLLSHNLIESDDVLSDIEPVNSLIERNICITSKGYYYCYVLVKRFHYHAHVVYDTPIYSENDFNMMHDIATSTPNNNILGIKKRVELVKLFLKYLRNQHNLQSDRLLKDFNVYMQDIFQSLDTEIIKIENYIKTLNKY